MKNLKHTPAPWFTNVVGDNIIRFDSMIYSTKDLGRPICQLQNQHFSDEENTANIKLIAAALEEYRKGNPVWRRPFFLCYAIPRLHPQSLHRPASLP